MTGACCVRQTRILIIIGMFILCQVDRFTLHQKFTSFSSTKVVTPLHDNVNKPGKLGYLCQVSEQKFGIFRLT